MTPHILVWARERVPGRESELGPAPGLSLLYANLKLLGRSFPPARYGYPCPQFTVPRVWWGRYPALRPCLRLNLHSLFIPPRGQLHTAVPSVRLLNAWGGGVTLS